MELADTSAWWFHPRSATTLHDFTGKLGRGAIATCDAVIFELLFSERDHDSVAARRNDLDRLASAPIGERVWRRALDVVEEIAARGPLHRQIPLEDLLIAAAAERAEIPVLHYDRHFEVIASITGQPVRALAPLGSL